ncbi:MAG TPA: hypothetical protein VKQ72_05665, partial [Aggregatilineales bacterium]|nr:hypothetical protein [Aggregatilineales bacterium]
VRQDAQRHWYEIRPEPLAELDAWLQAYRHLWEARFERMDALLTELQKKEEETEKDESQADH